MKEYCIKKRLKWSECAARNACRENEYYEDLIRYLRKNLAVCKFYLYVKKRLEEKLHAMMNLYYIYGDWCLLVSHGGQYIYLY